MNIKKMSLLILGIVSFNSCTTTKSSDPTEFDFTNPSPELVKEIDSYTLETMEEWLEMTILGFQKGRELTDKEQIYAKVIGIPDPENIRILETNTFEPLTKKLRDLQLKLGQPNNFQTLGGAQLYKTILVNINNKDKEETIQHELVHVAQDIRMGLIEKIRFHQLELKYLGYGGSTLENEAYNHP